MFIPLFADTQAAGETHCCAARQEQEEDGVREVSLPSRLKHVDHKPSVSLSAALAQLVKEQLLSRRQSLFSAIWGFLDVKSKHEQTDRAVCGRGILPFRVLRPGFLRTEAAMIYFVLHSESLGAFDGSRVLEIESPVKLLSVGSMTNTCSVFQLANALVFLF